MPKGLWAKFKAHPLLEAAGLAQTISGIWGWVVAIPALLVAGYTGVSAVLAQVPSYYAIPLGLLVLFMVVHLLRIGVVFIKKMTPEPTTFEVSVDREVVAADRDGQERFIAINLKNVSAKDITDCLVQVEEMKGDHPANPWISLPLVVRTEGQVRGEGSGRFILSAGQTKKIPLLWRSRNRRNQRLIVDEKGHGYQLTDGEFAMLVCVYGGNASARLTVHVDAFFTAERKRISFVEFLKLAEASGIPLFQSDDCATRFFRDLKQAGYDGILKFSGKRMRYVQPATWMNPELTIQEVIAPIPKKHWEDANLDAHSVFVADHSGKVTGVGGDNFGVESRRPGLTIDGYRDLHVDEPGASDWLVRWKNHG